jgi:hypothetical protein
LDFGATIFGNALERTMYAQHILGERQYELADHLGNVMATVSAKRAAGYFVAFKVLPFEERLSYTF